MKDCSHIEIFPPKSFCLNAKNWQESDKVNMRRMKSMFSLVTSSLVIPRKIRES